MNISNSEHPVIQAVPGVHAGPDTGGLDVILIVVLFMLLGTVGALSAVYAACKDRSRSSKKSKARAEALCECGEGRGGGGGGGGDSGMSKKLIEAVNGGDGL